MKVYATPPKDEVVIVKGDDGEYAWYHIKVTQLTDGRKLGNMRYDVEGHIFSNLAAATRHVCETRGLVDFIDDRRGGAPRRKMTGLDLVQRGLWHKFAELRKLDVRNTDLMQRDYYLSQQEEQLLGTT